MLFRQRKPESEKPCSDTSRDQLYGHKYGILFDIDPQISYLNDRICRLFAELFPLFDGFPEGIWISQQTVSEGLNACQVRFWVFAKTSDALKEFAIWFEAFFRREGVIELFERFVQSALDEPDTLKVTLADWSRELVTDAELRKAVEGELGEGIL